MSLTYRLKKIAVLGGFATLLAMPAVFASDVDELTMLLNNFLANVTEAETHSRFWADDLIYTSSRGTRTTKTEIMAGFAESGADDASDSDSGPEYAAENLQIQVYGDAAVVAFRLVATPGGGSARQEYLNTGTFLKREDQWQVVAWQATVIPATIIPAQ